MWALYRTFFISHVQYVLCHSRPKKPLLLGLVYVLPYHRRHERRAAAAATRRAAGCPSPRVWYEFLVSFDNRWPRVMIAITVHGSKNIYLLYVMQRTYTVHILVTKSNSGEAGRGGGGGWRRLQSQLMRRTLTINNFFLIVWCFFPVCTRAARFFQRLRIVRHRSGAAATPPPRRVGDIAGGSNHTWVKRGTNFFINEKRLKIWNPKANKTTARLKSLFRLEGCAMSPSE